MSELNYINAVNAYDKAAKAHGISVSAGEDELDFGNMVANAIGGVKETVDTAEISAKQSLAGEVGIEDLAIAVANAEVSLQALVSIRDKIVSAYQDIIRMPI